MYRSSPNSEEMATRGAHFNLQKLIEPFNEKDYNEDYILTNSILRYQLKQLDPSNYRKYPIYDKYEIDSFKDTLIDKYNSRFFPFELCFNAYRNFYKEEKMLMNFSQRMKKKEQEYYNNMNITNINNYNNNSNYTNYKNKEYYKSMEIFKNKENYYKEKKKKKETELSKEKEHEQEKDKDKDKDKDNGQEKEKETEREGDGDGEGEGEGEEGEGEGEQEKSEHGNEIMSYCSPNIQGKKWSEMK